MSNSLYLLKGKKVVVIGGSSGIGRSVAAATLAHGASVVIASSSQDKVNTALDRLKQGISSQSNVTVTGQALDLKDFDALKEFLTKEGPFDHLVITAGSFSGVPNFPQDFDIDGLKDAFDVRYWSVIIAAQHIYKNKLINPGGSITLTIGTVYQRPLDGFGAVTGLIGSVESSTRGLAIDLKPIRVNTIAPGVVDTEIFNPLPNGVKEGLFDKHGKNIPVGHIGEPDELAEAYLFAMKCTYLTGQVISVDGGAVLV
ncbi:unnamed protein product [Rhizoctonia solani]|uniref:Uncharacterized protein n=1 Tax=Rhizoctonia solani TaxID=456999 RepID=A0A8H3HTY8_9AGAM|nr:unnamed protein product [Rhizoctonia solani]CAE7230657.1 unnamed protein product [Rhizoctonia solani]